MSGVIAATTGESGRPAIYISNAGSDANAGLSPSFPLATVSAAVAKIGASGVKSLRFRCGDYWENDPLDLSSVSGVDIGNYGTGAQPIISGAAPLATWAKTAGRSAVYQANFTHDQTGTNRFYILDGTGAILKRVADIATCDSTPGSFVDMYAAQGATLTAYVHTADGSDPTGQGYKINLRIAYQGGLGAKIVGIQTQCAVRNDGSCVASAGATTNSDVRQVLAVNGTKHNILIGGGSATDCIAYHADTVTAYEGINVPLVSFLGTATGQAYRFERCGSIIDPSIATDCVAFYAHSGDLTTYASGTMAQCWATGNQYFTPSGGTGSYGDSTFTGCYDYRSINLGFMGECTSRYCLANDGFSLGINNMLTKVNTQDCAAYCQSRPDNTSGAKTFPVLLPNGSGCEIVITNCSFVIQPSTTNIYGIQNIMGNNSATGNLYCYNTVFYGGNGHINVNTGLSYYGDYNVFFVDVNDLNPFNCTWHGYTPVHSLAAWQSATGQDANSVYLAAVDQASGNANAFWLGVKNGTGGPVNGDFRVNATARVYGTNGTAYVGTYPNGVPIGGSGQQNHWDWNARAAASGAAAAWPNVPTTLVDSQSYTKSPQQWVF